MFKKSEMDEELLVKLIETWTTKEQMQMLTLQTVITDSNSVAMKVTRIIWNSRKGNSHKRGRS